MDNRPARFRPLPPAPPADGPSVFEAYYRELLNFLANRLRDREAAADLAQESYARVYAAEKAGTVIRDPRALLYRTARNLLTDGYRRAEVRGELGGQAGADGRGEGRADGDPARDAEALAGPAALEPEEALAGRQRFEAIAAVIEKLPPRCREAFVLVKFDGLTHVEAAARMGVAVKTVEMQVQLALVACRRRLAVLDGQVMEVADAGRTPRGRPRKPPAVASTPAQAARHEAVPSSQAAAPAPPAPTRSSAAGSDPSWPSAPVSRPT